MKDDSRSDPKHLPAPSEPVEQDPSAKFAYDLATQPPIKDVASVKAASDIFDANPKEAARPVKGEPGATKAHARKR